MVEMKTTSQAEDFGFVGRSLPIPGLAKKSYGLVLSSKENYLKKKQNLCFSNLIKTQ